MSDLRRCICLLFATGVSFVGLLSAAPSVGALNASPSSIPAGTATSVTVTTAIAAGTPLTGGVNLIQENASGGVLGILGVMHDDGLNGDAVAGDGIYTLVVSLTPDSQTTAIYLQTAAAFAGALQRIKSSVLTIQVTQPAPSISVNPTSLTFPSQTLNSSSTPQSFTITNTGSSPVIISSVTTSGDFAVSANTCPPSLTGGASCSVSITFTPSTTGSRTSSVSITDNVVGSPQTVSLNGTGQQATGPFTITSFGPPSGAIGTVVKVVLNNFSPGGGAAPTVTLPSLQGGTISAPIASDSQNALSFTIPAGAATGAFTVALSGNSATSATPFSVTTSSNFTLNVGPGTANLIQGQSVSYAITMASSNGFNGLANLAVSGLPSGLQTSLKPQALTAGQTSILTITAPANQALGTSTVSVSASASIDGQSVSQTASAGLNVTAVTTTFLGRTVAADPTETPLTAVTITTLGTDGSGNATSCNGYTAVSDAAGNFALTNLPSTCTGAQMIGFDPSKATGAPGKYGGARLIFALTNGQVTAAPVLVHLPRTDTAETVYVQQNASTDQTFYSSSVPGVSFTVYAGTTLTLPDGTQPNPFPMGFVPVLPDRLPYPTSQGSTAFGAFYLSLQPNGTHASQPVAVTYPNVLNTPPGTKVNLMMALNSVYGATQSASANAQASGVKALRSALASSSSLASIGTATVSADGSLIVPDPDPSHPGHAFGETYFDW